ncbi:MAG TPA: hypothetical protein VF116_01190 [Ktedonobacterales bacterium]
MDDSGIGILIVIVVVAMVVATIVAVTLSVGFFLLSGAAIVGALYGVVVAMRNFVAVLVEAHHKIA